ncbi:MAG: aminodeoxychorismate/anthranilate synthase component II [Halobacteria archaeon]|nr:aminodeoxychorismate/anthranilate synthase component II [Halobacteria archaeon]
MKNEMTPVTIAIIDNYDSFAHNLEQYVGEFADVEVGRYESPPEADGIIFSPGPGKPSDFPVMYDVLRETDVPVLGVCLGHQAIAEFFGGSVGYADEVVHGKTSMIEHDAEGVFARISEPMQVGRYHSLVVSDTDAPDELEVVARGAGEIMGIRHVERPVHGVQFHPESILTPEGKKLVRNFVGIVESYRHG